MKFTPLQATRVRSLCHLYSSYILISSPEEDLRWCTGLTHRDDVYLVNWRTKLQFQSVSLVQSMIGQQILWGAEAHPSLLGFVRRREPSGRVQHRSLIRAFWTAWVVWYCSHSRVRYCCTEKQQTPQKKIIIEISAYELKKLINFQCFFAKYIHTCICIWHVNWILSLLQYWCSLF